jgi:hypothetical protein
VRKPKPIDREPAPIPIVVQPPDVSGEIDKFIDSLFGNIGVGGGISRPPGESTCLVFPASPALGTQQLRFPSFRRIVGFASGATSVAITKNGMTVTGSGVIADAAGNALSAPVNVASGQIIFAGTLTVANSWFGFNVPLNVGEILYVSKNQASIQQVTLYFDLE